MNRVPRLPLPKYELYAELRYCAMLGGGEKIIGPFGTEYQRRRAIAAAQACYPGSHAPSARRYAVEVPR